MDQKFFYSGYKKVHAVKFQAIMAPDGLIIRLAGGLSISSSLTIVYFSFVYCYLLFVFYLLCLFYNMKLK